MNDLSADFATISDAAVFAAPPSLARVLALAEDALDGAARRDVRSAFQTLSVRLGVDLDTIPAIPDRVRALLADATPGRLGVSEKRSANLRSLVLRTVKRFGPKRTWVTREIAPSPAWKTLLAGIPQPQHRWGLSRLACYCTAKGIAPDKVSVDTLLGLYAALEAESLSKAPRNIVKHTISLWNMCCRRVSGWPETELSSPFRQEPFMLPLANFPESFRNDVAAWERRMSCADPLDSNAPVRPVRQVTLEGYRNTFRRLASALVRGGHLALEDVTGLDVFFADPERFKTALRPFLQGDRVGTKGYADKMARQMLSVARHHLMLPLDRLAPFEAIERRLRPRDEAGMGARNRTRLAQFDDADIVRRLLAFPQEELVRARAATSPLRQAKGVERALAISLEIHLGLRVKNLRTLQMDRNLRRAGDRVFVTLDGDDMKTHARLELELPGEAIALLDLFLDAHRPRLPGADGPYLFPGQNGAARSYAAMRDALSRTLRKHAGIEMSPHLYRHAIAKIVVERHPELALDVSRRLGHRSLRTTYAAYLGTEGPAASRRISALLEEVRDGTTPEVGA